MLGIFGKSKELEGEIENFLFTIQHAAMVFYEAIKDYCAGEFELFEKRSEEIRSLESKADELRREIKRKLYVHMLIPDARGDVLGLLETLDDVVDAAESIVLHFSMEMPDIPEEYRTDIIKMAEYSERTVDELVKAANAFFTDIRTTNDYINKVYFFEHEVDKIEERIKRALFKTKDIDSLSHKMHLRGFIERIADLSDLAEQVADRLSVYVIKRFM